GLSGTGRGAPGALSGVGRTRTTRAGHSGDPTSGAESAAGPGSEWCRRGHRNDPDHPQRLRHEAQEGPTPVGIGVGPSLFLRGQETVRYHSPIAFTWMIEVFGGRGSVDS